MKSSQNTDGKQGQSDRNQESTNASNLQSRSGNTTESDSDTERRGEPKQDGHKRKKKRPPKKSRSDERRTGSFQFPEIHDEENKDAARLYLRSQGMSVDAVNVVRRVYKVETLNEDAEYRGGRKKPFTRRIRKLIKICGYGPDCVFNSVPIVRWLPEYSIEKYLFGDCVAGATSAVMHIPQGMAYALLAEVPPIVGLYMAFFPILLYIVFGTSPHISMGTFAVACLMVGKVISQHSTTTGPNTIGNTTGYSSLEFDSEGTVQYAPLEVLGALCFGVGCFQILMWSLRLGAVSTLLSEPLVSGFTCAASFHVLFSQVKEIIGVKIPKHKGNYKIIMTSIDIFKNISTTNFATCVVSLVTCATILLNNLCLKPWVSTKCRYPVPIELFVIVIGTLSCRYAQLASIFNINIIGTVPTGLPAPAIPSFELLPELAMDCFIITMVTYSITMSMAFIFAAKEKSDIDPNQELLALGASNLFASFFSCAPFCASISRSYIQYQAGSKTAITSLVSAMLILCVLLWIGPFFEQLPRCVLATMISVTLFSMYTKITDVCKFGRLSTLDGMVWIITFLTTLIINIDVGLVAGLLSSVGSLFIRFQRPYTCLLGRVGDTDLYLDIKRYRAASEVPGIKIFHYCGGLNFASKNLFRNMLFRKIGYMKLVEPVVEETSDGYDDVSKNESYVWDPTIANRVRCVIIDATAMSHVDVPGIKSLLTVQEELMANHIMVLLAGANAPILELIDDYNHHARESFVMPLFPTVHDAVIYFQLMEEAKRNNGRPGAVSISDFNIQGGPAIS